MQGKQIDLWLPCRGLEFKDSHAVRYRAPHLGLAHKYYNWLCFSVKAASLKERFWGMGHAKAPRAHIQADTCWSSGVYIFRYRKSPLPLPFDPPSISYFVALHRMADPARQPRTLVLCFDGSSNEYDEDVGKVIPHLVREELICPFSICRTPM